VKLLHTSDWHLGHVLADRQRTREHAAFLDQLITIIVSESIDLLIVSGDIFDTGYPPNYALTQYFEFLWKLMKTGCKTAIIAAGNHDAPSTLNAPRTLLRRFGVHVFGEVDRVDDADLVTVPDDNGEPAALVCVVPFLRARDLRRRADGEAPLDRQQSVAAGIARHYRDLARLAEHRRHRLEESTGGRIPVIATGHLFTAGGAADDSLRELYVGDLGLVSADIFPDVFDYVALGHLHRPQMVGGRNHIRYSGAPLPLTFSQAATERGVLIADFDARAQPAVSFHPIPSFRRLFRITGTFSEAAGRLTELAETITADEPTPFAALEITTEHFDPTLYERAMALGEELPLEILMVKAIRTGEKGAEVLEEAADDLRDLTPEAVFSLKCDAEGVSPEDREMLMEAFREILAEVIDR
jgi:exonuclease SbcD